MSLKCVFSILLACSCLVNANRNKMLETNSLDFTKNVNKAEGLLVDHDIRLPVSAVKSDYYQTNDNNGRPPPLPFDRSHAGSRRDAKDELWTEMPVPYAIDSSVDSLIRFKIGVAMEDYKKYTCIRFREKTDSDKNWINFVGNDDGCWSYVGKYGTGGQKVSLQNNRCMRLKTVVHEIMHALGFWHEQSRPDRDEYVKIHYENIKPGIEDNFDKLNPDITESYGVAYDYRSVMHYYANTFSKNGKNTITRVDGGAPVFGQPYEGSLSALDIEQINILYNCSTGWGPWSKPSACSVTCGVGKLTFNRECFNKSAGCNGDSTRYEDCFKSPCPDVGEWGSWSAIGPCTVSCGTGLKLFKRSCPTNNCNGTSIKTEYCTEPECGQWTDWKTGSCNSTCGEAYRPLTRECIGTTTKNVTDSCPGESVKYEKCNLTACQWSAWQEGACSVTCGSGLQIFTRTCPKTDACVGSPVRIDPCTRPPCSSGVWGSWQAGACSVTCGAGVQIFTRNCSTSNCTGEALKFEPCIRPDCIMSQWTDWKSSSCNSTCGEGYRTLTRECIDMKTQNKTGSCRGDSVKYEKCNLTACPGVWGSWQASGCSVSCGTGVQMFTRNCSKSKCVGEGMKFEPCIMPDCIISEWTDWKSSSCNATCGEGYRTLKRKCIDLKTQNVTDSCPGESVKYEKCNLTACPGVWGSWKASSCSVSCGTGVQMFTRNCSKANCVGEGMKFEPCIMPDCSAGVWGSWKAGSCSVTCGGGIQVFTRNCSTSNCTGEAVKFEQCIRPDCLTIQWSNWTSDSCNATCGEGYRKLTRKCIDVKTQNEANSCNGVNMMYQKCNLPPCFGEWSSWQEGSCSRSCGTGTLVFTRRCSTSNCTGVSTKVGACHRLPCECFPSTAFVRSKGGAKILMKDLKIGDEVLTMNNDGFPIYSKIIMMLHQDPHQTMHNYVHIKTHRGVDITMSSKHLIPVSKRNFVFAKNIQRGQNITVFDERTDTFIRTEVIATNQVTDNGLFAPLSMEGTLIVNDVYVSCYAVFPSHTLSHYAFTLWRVMYTYFESITKYLSTNDEAIHWYPRTLYDMASYAGYH